MPGEAVTVKGERGDKRTWEEIIRKVSQKYYLATKTTFANSLGKKTQTFPAVSLALNLGRRILRLYIKLC